LLEGLRLRRHIGDEPEDRLTKLVLFGLPTAVCIVAIVVGFKVSAVDQMLTAVSVLVGALLAAFTQLAGWRERLSARQLKIDGIKMRALDEAVAHVLVAVLASAWMAGCLFVAASTTSAAVDIVCGAVTLATAVYLGVTLLIVVNLLWDAYRAANPESKPVVTQADPGQEEQTG
jgi:hypothetical protein